MMYLCRDILMTIYLSTLLLCFTDIVRSQNTTTEESPTESPNATALVPGVYPDIDRSAFGRERICFSLLHHYRLGNRCVRDNLEIARRTSTLEEQCYSVIGNMNCYGKLQFQCRNGMYMMGLLHENQLIAYNPEGEYLPGCQEAKAQLSLLIDTPTEKCTKMYEDIVECNKYHLDAIYGASVERTQVNTVFQFSPALSRKSICKIYERANVEAMEQCYAAAEIPGCFLKSNRDTPSHILGTIKRFCSEGCIDYEAKLLMLKQCPYGLPDEVSAMLLILNNDTLPERLEEYQGNTFKCESIQNYLDEVGQCVLGAIGECPTLDYIMRRTGHYIQFSAIDDPIPLMRQAIDRCRIDLPFDFYQGSANIGKPFVWYAVTLAVIAFEMGVFYS